MISSYFRNHLASVFYVVFLEKLTVLDEETMQTLSYIEALCSLSHFTNYFSAPFLLESECERQISELLADCTMKEKVVSFLMLLIRYKALSLFGEIKTRAEEKWCRCHQSGIVHGEVFVTDLTDKNLIEQAKKHMASFLRTECEWKEIIDNTMLAGIRFKLGDIVIEKSVSRNVSKLKEELMLD